MKGKVYQDKRKGLGTYYYVVDVGVQADGKRKQKRKGGFTFKKDAQAALAKVLTEINLGTFIEPSKVLYKDYFDEWLINKRPTIGRQTYESYLQYAKSHINPAIGNSALSNITPVLIQKLIRELNAKQLADATVKRIFNLVNTSLSSAVKLELIYKNPAAAVDRPRVSKKEMKVWSKDELLHFLAVAQQETFYSVAFYLAAFTGMRQGELLGLRWCDVDFERKTLSVVQTMSHDGKELRIGTKSTSGNRTIAIPDVTVDMLRKHRRLQLEGAMKMGAGKAFNVDNLVICTSCGTWTTPRILYKAFVTIVRKANLPKIRFHGIRHTHATMLLEMGEHPKIVQERLGHSSIQMTLDTYSHVTKNMQSNTAKLFGDYLQ